MESCLHTFRVWRRRISCKVGLVLLYALSGCGSGASHEGKGDGTGGTAARGGSAATGGSQSGASSGGDGAGGVGATSGVAGSSGIGGGAGTSGSGGSGTVRVTSDFTSDTEGWQGAFSDYPQGEETFYELEWRQEALPASLGPGGGILMGGNNHSDDLFTYLARRITGLVPSTAYALDVTVLIGSNAPSDCGGIGGSPSKSVFFKIGGSPIEPASSLDSDGFLRLNLDKGQQSAGGTDMKVVGDIGNTLLCPDDTYQAKTLSLTGFGVQSAADGSVWVIVGTDSGFEGITELYYDRISLTLTRAN